MTILSRCRSAAAISLVLLLSNAACGSCPNPSTTAYPNGEPMPPHHAHGADDSAHGPHGQHGTSGHHGHHKGPSGRDGAQGHRGSPQHGNGSQHGSHGSEGHAHTGTPLVHRFDEAADWQKRFEGPERDASQKPAEVIQAMAIRPGARVADVGTGTGYFLSYLSAAVGPSGQVIAADIEPSMVRFVKQRAAENKLANVSPRLVLGDDPLLPDAALDRIVIVNTWHHIPERVAYAAKLRQALVAGGSLWIIDFKLDAPRGPDRKHRLAPEQIQQELTAAGFSVRIDDALLPHQYIAIGSPIAADD